jgi:hypothetical protein
MSTYGRPNPWNPSQLIARRGPPRRRIIRSSRGAGLNLAPPAEIHEKSQSKFCPLLGSLDTTTGSNTPKSNVHLTLASPSYPQTKNSPPGGDLNPGVRRTEHVPGRTQAPPSLKSVTTRPHNLLQPRNLIQHRLGSDLRCTELTTCCIYTHPRYSRCPHVPIRPSPSMVLLLRTTYVFLAYPAYSQQARQPEASQGCPAHTEPRGPARAGSPRIGRAYIRTRKRGEVRSRKSETTPTYDGALSPT